MTENLQEKRPRPRSIGMSYKTKGAIPKRSTADERVPLTREISEQTTEILNLTKSFEGNADISELAKTIEETFRKGVGIESESVVNEIIPTQVRTDTESQDINTELNTRHRGWLFKLGGKNLNMNYKRRWCVMKRNSLFYYKNEEDAKPQGWLNLSNYTECEISTAPSGRHLPSEKEFCFKLVDPKDKAHFYMIARNKMDMERWMKCLNVGIKTCSDFPEPNAAKKNAGMSFREMEEKVYLSHDSIARAGVLKKLGGKNNQKMWKKRYFICFDHSLIYYSSKDSPRPLGVVSLYEYINCYKQEPQSTEITKRVEDDVDDDDEEEDEEEVEEEKQKDGKYIFEVANSFANNKRKFVLASHDERDMELWMNVIQINMSK